MHKKGFGVGFWAGGKGRRKWFGSRQLRPPATPNDIPSFSSKDLYNMADCKTPLLPRTVSYKTSTSLDQFPFVDPSRWVRRRRCLLIASLLPTADPPTLDRILFRLLQSTVDDRVRGGSSVSHLELLGSKEGGGIEGQGVRFFGDLGMSDLLPSAPSFLLSDPPPAPMSSRRHQDPRRSRFRLPVAHFFFLPPSLDLTLDLLWRRPHAPPHLCIPRQPPSADDPHPGAQVGRTSQEKT